MGQALSRRLCQECFERRTLGSFATAPTRPGGEALAGTVVDGRGTWPAASPEQPNRNAPERTTGNHGGHEESSVTRDAGRPWTAADQGSRTVGRRPILRGLAATATGVGRTSTAPLWRRGSSCLWCYTNAACPLSRQMADGESSSRLRFGLRRLARAACVTIFWTVPVRGNHWAVTVAPVRAARAEPGYKLPAEGQRRLLSPGCAKERGAPVFRDRREMLSRKTRELAASAHQRDRDKSLALSPSRSEPPDERTLWRFHLRYPARGCRCRL
ncbi:hypothetical protein MRX96_030960 [Rhipicephalus microplus]